MVTSLRTRLSVIAVVAVSVAGCSESPASLVSPAAPSSLGASTAVKPTLPTLGAQLAAVRAATSKYHDVDAAVAAGYLPPTAPCVESPNGAMGIHSANPSLLVDQSVDPLQPEVLLYLPKPGGGVRLVGVEYLMTVLVSNGGTPQPWFSPDPWGAEYTVVTPTPSLFGQTFAGPMPGHDPGMPWHFDLHVWTWSPNPAGMFAIWNPAISCANAGT